MTEFRFTTDHTKTEVAGIIDFLRQPRLWIPTESDYPNYHEWLEKTEAQIITDKKHAMAAYMDNDAVGTIIYQEHEEHPNVVEIRNISVSPTTRGRYIGSFLLRNGELEAANDFPGATQMVVDTKITNTGMIDFLLECNYQFQEVTDLYGSGTGLDVILTKSIES